MISYAVVKRGQSGGIHAASVEGSCVTAFRERTVMPI